VQENRFCEIILIICLKIYTPMRSKTNYLNPQINNFNTVALLFLFGCNCYKTKKIKRNVAPGV
jgi:hypothetical protein